MISPGSAHPYAPIDPDGLAEFLHVTRDEVNYWLDNGLPTTPDGLIDPFACSNWLCWGYLERCPVLARRWRTYLIFFAPFVAGQDRSRSVKWQQVRHLYTEESVENVQWSIARGINTESQICDDNEVISAPSFDYEHDEQWLHFNSKTVDPLLEIHTERHVRIMPRHTLTEQSSEFNELHKAVEEVAGNFRYEYRHHQHAVHRAAILGTGKPEVQWSGSCLDCAMTLGALLTDRHRPWRMIAGKVAHSQIANPHFWLETQIAGGDWVPLDASLPAIVRMVGGDWQKAARAWTGNLDARRITLGVVGPGITTIPDGSTLGSMMGEAVINKRNAWTCLDWVCGDCEGTFTELE